MQCDRCHKAAPAWTMSVFNEDIICMPCKAKERAHPAYAAANEAEMAACQRGDYNFPGVGKPRDL